jgi:outer membrane biosynthesis protein TonB
MIFSARRGVALLCACVLSGVARAEAPKPAPAAPPPSAASVPAPAQSSATKPATPPPAAPVAPAATESAPKPTAPAALSESKYLSVLYGEISRHTPQENAAGPGEVTASFIIGRTGRVEKVTIDRTSSPAHAEIVKKILSEVVTPPPPGGTMDVGQTFRFH